MTPFGTGAAAFDVPAFLELEVTGACQISCVHCIGRAAVLPDGDLVPCVIGRWMHAGNVKETPVAGILAGQAWRDALALVPRRADPCPPASDGNDCPPASEPACGPSYCGPDTGDGLRAVIPAARVTARRAG